MPLLYRCVCCRKYPVEDEYHWWTDDGKEVVWKLCGDCCEFACGVAEIIANIEEEVEQWLNQD